MAKNLWIFGYKMASKGARDLADAMDVWMIKHEESNFVGKRDDVVLNWGAGTTVFNANLGAATLLNDPRKIDRSINKLAFFYDMSRGEGCPRIPTFTERQERARGWLDAGKIVIARQKLEGAKGAGLVVVHNPDEMVPAPLYTMKVDNTAEYRIYMFNGEPVDARIKLLNREASPDPDHMRNDDRGYEFCQIRGGLASVPADVLHQARLACAKTGLFTGGLDVVWDGETQQATVLEMNTAPYLGERTVEIYSTKLREYLAA